MKYVTAIGLLWIVIYNFCGDNNYILWRFSFYFPIMAMLTYAFWELRKKEPVKIVRSLYLSALVFFGLYTIFQLLTLFSKDEGEYLGTVNSWVWSGIIGTVVITFLLATIYDKGK